MTYTITLSTGEKLEVLQKGETQYTLGYRYGFKFGCVVGGAVGAPIGAFLFWLLTG